MNLSHPAAAQRPIRASIIDTHVLSSYIGPNNDFSLITYLLSYFKQSAPEKLSAARSTFANNDQVKCAYFLHSLKNSLLNLGATATALECQDLEDNLKRIDLKEFDIRLDRLGHCTEEIITAVTRYLDSSINPASDTGVARLS